MKLLSTLFIMVIFSTQLFASHIGLKIGNNLSLAPMQGDLSMNCHYDEGDTYVHYDCASKGFFPNNYSYLLGPKQSDLKKVDLVIKTQNGAPYFMNKLHYKGKKGRTRYELRFIEKSKWVGQVCDIFNPVLPLEIGQNIVDYTFYNPKTHKEISGSFTITLKDKKLVTCPKAKMYSNSSQACWASNRKKVCAQYFTNCKR